MAPSATRCRASFSTVLIGTEALEVFPVASALPVSQLRSASEDHDRAQTEMADIDAFFPTTRLRELATDGVIGSVAREHQRILPNYSQRKVLEVDAPGRPLDLFVSRWQLAADGFESPRPGWRIEGAFLFTGRVSGGLPRRPKR